MAMRVARIDSEWDWDYALSGYLLSPDGHRLRWIRGLESIAGNYSSCDVSVIWMRLPGGRSACCDRSGRRVYVSPWMFWAWPAFLRDVLRHELGHVVAGSDD